MMERLLRSEKIDSLLILVIPVINPRSRYGLVLNEAFNKLRKNPVSSSQ